MSIFLLPELEYDKAPLLLHAQQQTNWNSNPIMPGVFSAQWGEITETIDPVFDEILSHFSNAFHVVGCVCPKRHNGMLGCSCSIPGCTPRIIGACFMQIKPGSVLREHVDPGRYTGVNCPLTQSLADGGVDIYSKGIVVSKVYTDCPYIIDTQSPHGAHNNASESNIFLSLTFNQNLDFAQLVDWQVHGELLQ